MANPPGPLITVDNAAQWREWLASNRTDHPDGVWLVYFKPHAKKSCASYNESVEEALCFGWIDSLVRRIDEDRYARKFTPRKTNSNWSASNRKRVENLQARGRMTPAGQVLVDDAKQAGRWKDKEAPKVSQNMPLTFKKGLSADPDAAHFFSSLTVRQKSEFITWINIAVRPATRKKRISESLDLLSQRKKFGMK